MSSAPLDLAEGRGLSQDTIEALVLIGLPKGIDWSLDFSEVGVLPLRPSGIVIGDDGGVPIVIDQAGQKVHVDLDGSLTYINANARLMLEFLLIYQLVRERVVNMSEGAAQRLIGQMEDEMSEIDATAFEDANHYWPLIVAQLRVGLL